MPKRSYPFDESNLPQRKVHLNAKRVATGDEAALKQVYRKTLAKLFKGSNAKSGEVGANGEDELRDVLYDCSACKSSETCGTTRCHFCDNLLCANCERRCNVCRETFCRTCSLAMHATNLDIVCLHCLR